MEEQFDKTYKDSDEFDFDINENGKIDPSVYETAIPKKKRSTVFGRLNFQTIFTFIGFIVLCFVLYKFVNVFFIAKNKAIISEAAITSSLHALKTPAKPEVAAPPPVVAPTAPAPLPAAVSPNTEQMQSLQNQVAALATSLSTLQTNMNALTTQLAAQNARLDDLQTKLEHQPEKPVVYHHAEHRHKKIKHHKPSKHAHARPIYRLQSVIPGRAWLVDTMGKNLTVTTGTSLNGYGRVKAINAASGKVYTTSGAIISYNP